MKSISSLGTMIFKGVNNVKNMYGNNLFKCLFMSHHFAEHVVNKLGIRTIYTVNIYLKVVNRSFRPAHKLVKSTATAMETGA